MDRNQLSNSDLPMGLSMALGQNPEAMLCFSRLTPQQQKEVITHTHALTSKQEMRAFVASLTDSSVITKL